MSPLATARYDLEARRARTRALRRRRRRRALVVVVATVAVVAAASVALGGRRHHGPSGTTASGASGPAQTAATSGTDPTTTTLRAPAVERAPFAVASVTLPLMDGSRPVPTIVRYPAVRVHGTLIPARKAAPFPLIVFSGGWKVEPSAYRDLLGAWTAAGYVVAFPEYPGTLPGEKTPGEGDIANHPGDLLAVLTALHHATGPLDGLIDQARLGLAGHSDGGDVTDAIVANSCCHIAGVTAAVILSGAELDSWRGAYGPPSVPLLVVQGDADVVNRPACSQQIYDAAGTTRFYLDLLGAGHYSPYLDGSALVGQHVDAGVARAPAYRTAVVQSTLGFWHQYLSGTGGSSWTAAADVPGVSQLTAGAPVPQTGSCPP